MPKNQVGDKETKKHRVWQLTDGTVIVQSDEDLQAKLGSGAWPKRPSFGRRLKHKVLKIVDKI